MPSKAVVFTPQYVHRAPEALMKMSFRFSRSKEVMRFHIYKLPGNVDAASQETILRGTRCIS